MNKEVIMTALDTLTAGRTDDQTLELIEAITNELNTADDGGEDSTAELDEYEAKLAACEETWRNKYRTAFFHGAEEEEQEEEEEEEGKEEMTDYDELFKKGNE